MSARTALKIPAHYVRSLTVRGRMWTGNYLEKITLARYLARVCPGVGPIYAKKSQGGTWVFIDEATFKSDMEWMLKM